LLKHSLTEQFNGNVRPIENLLQPVQMQACIISTRRIVESTYASYDSPSQQAYRVKFYNEKTGEEIVGLHIVNMKMCIDACLRMSCGAASKGGDTKITNIILQDASFPLSIGRTEHSFLLGTFNCGETDQWIGSIVGLLRSSILSDLHAKCSYVIAYL
jgi:hypothetical protein